METGSATPTDPSHADALPVCPVTGLPIRSRPEWTERRFGRGFRLTTRVVGDRILLNQPSGSAELQGLIDSLSHTDAVVRETIDDSAGYVHLSDYSGMRGITREARKYYIQHMEGRETMLGLIYFNVSPLFRIMIKLGKRFSIVKFNVQIVKDYPAAMAAAMQLIHDHRRPSSPGEPNGRAQSMEITEHYANGHQILRCGHWRLDLDGYTLTAEVIDRRIYHALSSGTLKGHHVAAVSRLREQVRRMTGLEDGFRAIVTGAGDAHNSDRNARRSYMEALRRWHQRYPVDLYVFYNANRFIRTATMLAIPFMPFKIKVAHDLEGALAFVERFTRTTPSAAEEALLPAPIAGDPTHGVHQLIQFIGDIDWEKHGAQLPEQVDAGHPLRPVFDAIALIKGELDALLEERRLSEKALRESQRRFDEVLKHSRDILFKRDLHKGTYEYVSDAVNELLGLTPEEACRISFDGLKTMIHPEDLPGFLAFHDALLNSMRASSLDQGVEYRLRDSQGKYRWFSEAATLVRNADGKPVSVIGSNRDISRVKALEAERHEIAEGLRRTRKLEAVNTMAGGVAHNFNNLLMVILGNLELMRAEIQADDGLVDRVDAIEKSAQRAADLSTLMLTFVGQTKISPRPLDLNQIMAEMVDVLQTTVADNASLILAPAERGAWIYADSGKVFQVITNLVTNAVEAFGEESLEIRINVGFQHCDTVQLSRFAPGENLPAGRYVSLRVADNGRGMDQETLEKVFDPFFTTKFTGRGLGMAAVMGIVRAHRGGIRIDSRLHGGTAVTVYFPEHIPAEPSKSRPVIDVAQHQGMALLVDDEPLILELGKQMLSLLGFDVLTASDGAAALETFARHGDRIGLAVLDINMPRMDGRETLLRLREMGASFPVLVASGFIEDQAREKFGDLRVDGFIKKPFRVEQLKEKIDRLFSSVDE